MVAERRSFSRAVDSPSGCDGGLGTLGIRQYALVADENLRASWARTEAHLRSAMAELSRPVGADWATEYLQPNELGLAFEALVEAASEQAASATVWAALRSAADEMCLRADDPVHGSAVARMDSHSA
jgi:hypothetical protein